MIAPELDQWRHDLGTDLWRAEFLAELAARMEPAARWRIQRAGYVAGEDDALASQHVGSDGNGRHQRLRVGMQRVAEELPPVGQLDHLAQVHHRDPVADVLDDAHVVGDEQVGQAELPLQLLQEVQDLRLDRDVEGRDRLVADDEVRLEGQRAGDPDPLSLAAGEFVRVAAGVVIFQARPGPSSG